MTSRVFYFPLESMNQKEKCLEGLTQNCSLTDTADISKLDYLL